MINDCKVKLSHEQIFGIQEIDKLLKNLNIKIEIINRQRKKKIWIFLFI
jgi:hypothetical protein